MIDVSKLTIEDATNLTLEDVSKLTMADVSKVTAKDVFNLQKAINHCAAPKKRFASKAETDYQGCIKRETSELDFDTLADNSKLKKAISHCKGQARIIGGQQIAYREYPWIVSIIKVLFIKS